MAMLHRIARVGESSGPRRPPGRATPGQDRENTRVNPAPGRAVSRVSDRPVSGQPNTVRWGTESMTATAA